MAESCYSIEVGVNLPYPKIGELDPYAMQQWIRVQRELSLLLDSGLNSDSENGDDVTA